MNVQQFEEISKKVITAIHHILDNSTIIKRFEDAVKDFTNSVDVDEYPFSTATVLIDQTTLNLQVPIPDYADYMAISVIPGSAFPVYLTMDGIFTRPSVVNEIVLDLMGFPIMNNRLTKLNCFNKRYVYLSWCNPSSVGQMTVNLQFFKRGNNVKR